MIKNLDYLLETKLFLNGVVGRYRVNLMIGSVDALVTEHEPITGQR